MVKLHEGGVYLVHGSEIVPASESARVEQLTGKAANQEEAKKGTIAYGIMKSHNTAETMDQLKIKFDAMVSHGHFGSLAGSGRSPASLTGGRGFAGS